MHVPSQCHRQRQCLPSAPAAAAPATLAASAPSEPPTAPTAPAAATAPAALTGCTTSCTAQRLQHWHIHTSCVTVGIADALDGANVDLCAASGEVKTSTDAVTSDIGNASGNNKHDNSTASEFQKMSELPWVPPPGTSTKLLAMNVDLSAQLATSELPQVRPPVTAAKLRAINVDLSAAGGRFRTSPGAVTSDIDKALGNKVGLSAASGIYQSVHRCGHH